jgi:peptide deformylase
MALRKILKDGEETLRKTSRAVEKIDDRVLELLDDMADTMYDAHGIGIAAPQVGVLKRIFLVDIGDGSGLFEFINPFFLRMEGSQICQEGCLSVPGLWGAVDRPAVVEIQALDRYGQTFTLQGEGLMADVLCHEYDHLEGILFKDKVRGELVKG